MTLEYNKPLEIKDKAGKVLFIVKNLTEDAEYELDMIVHIIKATTDDLYLSGKFYQPTQIYYSNIIESIENSTIENPTAKELKRREYLKGYFKKEEDLKNKKKQMMLSDDYILAKIPKGDLVNMSRWLQENIEGFETFGLLGNARKLQAVADAYYTYKEELKKK